MSFSIITCAHNPSKDTFQRLLGAVSRLHIPENCDVEWIIVDNNSIAPVITQFDFNSVGIRAIFVNEREPGLTHARLAGVRVAKGNWLVFFDDDNQPNPEYLLNAKKLINDYSDVACWGAGRIQVNYLAEKYDSWLDQKKEIFQERSVNETLTFNNIHWQKEYPQGTGLVCQKEVLLNYTERVKNGTFSLTDRMGKNLTSGGDVQIVLLAVKLGYLVGISGLLLLQHNIDKSKINFRYLVRLLYGMASSYVQAFNQVNDQDKIPFKKITNANILMILVNHIRYFKSKIFTKDALLKLSKQFAEANAIYVAYPEEAPPYLLKRASYFFQ